MVCASLRAAANVTLCLSLSTHGTIGVRALAVQNFFWTARALGLGSSSTLQQLRDAGVEYCSKSWAALHAQFEGAVADQFISRYCFGAAFTYVLLHDRLGIPQSERVLEFTNTVRRRLQRSERDGAGAGHGSATPHEADGDERAADVALSWVVGAILVHAMSTGRRGMLSVTAAMAAGDLASLRVGGVWSHVHLQPGPLLWVQLAAGLCAIAMIGVLIYLAYASRTRTHTLRRAPSSLV